MYNSFRQFCERLLRIPPDPEPPPGDQASMRLFRAAPNFYKYLLVVWALGTLFALLFLSMFFVAPVVLMMVETKAGKPWAPLLLVIPGIVFTLFVLTRLFSLAVLRLNFEKRWYVVTDRSLRIREGVVNVREMTVTFANIQNISISQGPIQRALGIADLQVDTAGGGAVTKGQQAAQNLHTAWFRGIDNANEVRELIQQRLRHLKDSGLGDHEEMETQSSPATSSAWVAALREIHDEARALREAARTLS